MYQNQSVKSYEYIEIATTTKNTLDRHLKFHCIGPQQVTQAAYETIFGMEIINIIWDTKEIYGEKKTVKNMAYT